jgi:hypothetical protein
MQPDSRAAPPGSQNGHEPAAHRPVRPSACSRRHSPAFRAAATGHAPAGGEGPALVPAARRGFPEPWAVLIALPADRAATMWRGEEAHLEIP